MAPSDRLFRLLLLSLSFQAVVWASPAFGQWRSQTIQLQPGWNAVYLEVQPQPDGSEAVFAALPVGSVWAWNQRYTSVQFIQDASTLVPEQPEWLKYFPPSADWAILTDLFAIRGGQAYLIRLDETEPVEWTVTGVPVTRPVDWLADSYNLTGFAVDPGAPPTFEGYLSPSPAHAEGPVYRLNGSGEWEVVADPATEQIRPGEAYWVYCKGSSRYSGPLRVVPEQGNGLDFGRILTEQTFRIRNETPATRQVQLNRTSSLPPPDPSSPPLAGDIPLSYWSWELPLPGWTEMSGTLTREIPPGGEVALRVAVRRRDMAPPASPGALYQNLLEITDGQGSKVVVPMISKGLVSEVPAAAGAQTAPQASGGRAGLWVGTAAVDRVSYPGDAATPLTPKPTVSEFPVRLIVHVDDLGQARLLQHVTMVWKDGTWKPDPDEPSKMIIDQPGRFVLVTDDSLLPQFTGAAVRDGEAVGRRISSAAFAFGEPVTLTGAFDGTLASGEILLDYNDRLNPFRHRYHPGHDNLDPRFVETLPEGRESYTISREISLSFLAEDPEGLELAGWGDNQVGGAYEERITGVHREELRVAGTFRLHHVSRVPVLNDGQ